MPSRARRREGDSIRENESAGCGYPTPLPPALEVRDTFRESRREMHHQLHGSMHAQEASNHVLALTLNPVFGIRLGWVEGEAPCI